MLVLSSGSFLLSLKQAREVTRGTFFSWNKQVKKFQTSKLKHTIPLKSCTGTLLLLPTFYWPKQVA